MTENPKLEDMDSDALSSSCEVGELEETQKISISDQTRSLRYANIKADSFIVDMERFSHLTNNDVSPNSRITRNVSRKGSQRSVDKKTDSNERDTATSSPRAALLGASTPEKTVGATDHPINPQVHHQITIMTGNVGAAAATAAAESRFGGRRLSFRRSSPPWTIDPKRILILFATLSSMGTILLIYFTLSMGKLNGDDNTLN